jgi:hypothetical protein
MMTMAIEVRKLPPKPSSDSNSAARPNIIIPPNIRRATVIQFITITNVNHPVRGGLTPNAVAW